MSFTASTNASQEEAISKKRYPVPGPAEGQYMKKLLLTGIANEVNFRESVSAFFLVFNDGEVRLPVDEETASRAVREMLGDSEDSEHRVEEGSDIEEGDGFHVPVPYPGTPAPETQYHKGVDISGAEYYSAQEDYSVPPDYRDDDDYEDIEDGVGQV